MKITISLDHNKAITHKGRIIIIVNLRIFERIGLFSSFSEANISLRRGSKGTLMEEGTNNRIVKIVKDTR
jgi:hypothetical protein